MKQCVRCDKWFPAVDSRVCDPCWVEMGQMTFDWEAETWEPSDTAEDDDDEYLPEIDTIFDQMAERENRFP